MFLKYHRFLLFIFIVGVPRLKVFFCYMSLSVRPPPDFIFSLVGSSNGIPGMANEQTLSEKKEPDIGRFVSSLAQNQK